MRYLQLAHNVWDPAAKRSRVQVLYNFGREDQLNRDAMERLVASVDPVLDPEPALAGGRAATAWSSPSPGRWAAPRSWTGCGGGSASTPS